MSKTRILFLLILALLRLPLICQAEEFSSMLSFKLRRFLSDNPNASRALSNAVTTAFAHRSIRLYYFYSDDERLRRAFHSFPDESSVSICVRENQSSVDEFLCLLFEVINSTSEKQFEEIYRAAEAGTVTKQDFAKGIAQAEFKTTKQVRELLKTIGIHSEDSYYCKAFLHCPDTFDDFLLYSKKVSRGIDPLGEYESQYDAIRNSALMVTPPHSTATNLFKKSTNP